MRYVTDRLRSKVSEVTAGDVALGAGAVGTGVLAAAPRQISDRLLKSTAKSFADLDRRLGPDVKAYVSKHKLTPSAFDPNNIKRTVTEMRKNDPKLVRRMQRGGRRVARRGLAAAGTRLLAASPVSRLGLGALSAGMAYGALKD